MKSPCNALGTTLALAAFFFIPLTTASAVVICTSPDLPPGCGEYRTPEQVHAAFANPDPAIIEVILQDASHSRFELPVITPLPGGDELEEFDSTLTGIVSITPLVGSIIQAPFVLTGPVQVVTDGKTGNTTGTFQTEMVSMSLSGNLGGIPIIVRESPSLPSIGVTTITDIGGGLYQIDSFFDIFTEISINGGAFVPQNSPSTHVVLVPEPSHALLSLVGIAALGLRRRRK